MADATLEKRLRLAGGHGSRGAVGRAVVFIAAMLVAGCASQPAPRWARTEAPDAAFKRDDYECERDTRQRFANDTRGIVFLAWKNADKRAFYERCMEAKGWHKEQQHD